MIPESVRVWVEEVRALCQPESVYWCDGSEEERVRLTAQAVQDGVLIPLNHDKLPNSYLHRSDPTDVARTEQVTFICSRAKDDAGPTNNWMSPEDARAKLTPLYAGAMRGLAYCGDGVLTDAGGMKWRVKHADGGRTFAEGQEPVAKEVRRAPRARAPRARARNGFK
jgi:hypothetical protein